MISAENIKDSLKDLTFSELRDVQIAVNDAFKTKAASELASREAELDELRALAGFRKRQVRKAPAVAGAAPTTRKPRAPKA